eukprot:g3276.t1
MKNLKRLPQDRLDMVNGKERLYSRLPPLFSKRGIISIYEADDVEHILKKKFETYIKPPLLIQFFGESLGTGIFLTNHGPRADDGGQKWKRQRKVAARIFTKNNFQHFFLDVFRIEAEDLCTHVLRSNIGRVIDIQQIMGRFTLSSIGKIAFGVEDLGGKDSTSPPPFAQAFDRAQALCFERFTNPFVMMLPPWLRVLVSSREAELYRCKRVLDDLCDRVIAEARKEQRVGGTNWLQRRDLMSLFMKESSRSGEAAFSDDDLRDVVLSFMIAGRDTTRTTLTFLFKILSENPDIEEKLLREISTVGDASPTTTWNALKSMQYLDGLIKETLRLYPPVWIDPKFSTREDVLPSGYRVPRETIVQYSPYNMGRIPDYLYGSKPEEIRPERWWNEKKRTSHYEFPVFQAGPRICLGMNMAYLEVKACVVEVLRNGFRLRTLPSTRVSDARLRYTAAPTLVLEGGLPARVGVRSGERLG